MLCSVSIVRSRHLISPILFRFRHNLVEEGLAMNSRKQSRPSWYDISVLLPQMILESRHGTGLAEASSKAHPGLTDCDPELNSAQMWNDRRILRTQTNRLMRCWI